MHIFPELLRHDGNVEEALERTVFADLRQLETTFSAIKGLVCLKKRKLVG